MTGSGDLAGCKVWMRDIHNVGALSKFYFSKISVCVRCGDFYRIATAIYDCATVFVNPKILIAKFQNIGLLDVELKRDQTHIVRAVLDLTHKDCARAPASAAMWMRDKVL